MTPFMPGPQRVNLEQLANAISFSKAQVQLHEVRREAWLKQGEKERALWTELFIRLLGSSGDSVAHSISQEALNRWTAAHKRWYEAQADIYQLEIAQYKSQLAIQEKMMEEAKNPGIVLPHSKVDA